ncbi:HAD family hydrolase [Tautonia sociabilis]|uniref:Haloacid dehalogenase n=1 Tax=Tautonia sociabilis TaxID=2080755 RepID=A0A432MGV5_9BACT|nr:HAD family hydrolase [Tautonia sociabilis]RUL86137.1 haloacid dehalogenase [Tautonia sociabilis]
MAATRYDVITFDCYGTLIDWERGIQDAFAGEAFRSGTTFDGDAILRAYHELEPRVEAETFRPYREVLGEMARRVSREFHWEIDPGRLGFLAESLPHWAPFPETGEALRRLAKEGYRLGILSNVDDDLLSASRRAMPDVFDPDLIVTAEAVGSYKPAVGHFEEARRRIGGCSWLHAAQSDFHDIQPATALGIPSAWVNRKRERSTGDGPRPILEVSSLKELADRLCGDSGRG